MNITYIHHSSFFVETEHAGLLFDYFEGELPKIPEDKPLYVLASHRHPDHFLPVIFTLAESHPDTWYILSDDIWRKRVPDNLKSRAVFMAPHETKTIPPDDRQTQTARLAAEDAPVSGQQEIWGIQKAAAFGVLTVETFRSNDEGVSFWCRIDGHTIYHAGDLNHWYWEGEEEEWNRGMTAAYHAELERMAGRTADVAFLPLDPRLERWFYLGVDDFMKKVDAVHVFPMHFWNDFSVTDRLRALPCSAAYRDRLADIKKKGQTFHMED